MKHIELYLRFFWRGGEARKTAFSFVMPCVRTEQRDFHWTDFHVRVISCLEFSRNLSVRPDFVLSRTTVTFCLKTSVHFCHVDGLPEPLLSARYELGRRNVDRNIAVERDRYLAVSSISIIIDYIVLLR